MYSDVEEAYKTLQKEMERQAIQTLLQVKTQEVQEMKQSSQMKLDAFASAMYQTSQRDLSGDLTGALTGKASEAGKSFLKNMKQLVFRSPVKGC